MMNSKRYIWGFRSI